MDMALSGATSPGQNQPANDGNERVLHILQSSSFTGTSPSDYLESYQGHILVCVCGGSYSSVEVQCR